MTFLKQVADYYIEKAKAQHIDLADYTFVFPNKRSAMFMRKYLKEAYSKVGFMPRLVTVTAFVQDFCATPLAKDAELLFILYNSYKKVLEKYGRADQIKDFDQFMFWGNVTLNDFNDVDAYMVDANQLFKNLYEEKIIEANYLTPEQIEVAHILGDRRPLKADVENFWKHIPRSSDQDNTADKFINLWEILGPLYKQFNGDLDTQGVAYSGKLSRLAYVATKEMNHDDFHGRKFAFIGFYVLSVARYMIFKRLKDLGIADFFWDTASPLLRAPGNRAGNIIFPLSRDLKAPADFTLDEIKEMPEITVYPVASNVAQVKACAQAIKEWGVDSDLDKGSVTTGVVMPSDKLLMPLLYSLPESFFPVNIAMKVPFAATPLASLMTTILQMQEKARRVKGEPHYFYKDVLEIISNPYIAMKLGGDCASLRDKIIKEHIYNVSATEIEKGYPSLAFIFEPVFDPSDMQHVKNYLRKLIASLNTIAPEREIIEAYTQAINDTFELAEKYSITMHEHTSFTLIRRLLSAAEVHFNGNPVWGLQLMNMPDARVLDFDNLAILSLNEGIMPAKNFRPSLIPPILRAGYGLPTRENEDDTLAYQFFRLISRAKKLALFYDSRTPDLSSGEKSRFISQLELLLDPKPKIKETKLGFAATNAQEIAICKSEDVLQELSRLKAGGNLNFSASAFKTYIECKLRFYLQYVKGLRTDNFDPEYMDASSYGRVLHKVAELFYDYLEKEVRGGEITPFIIREKLSDPKLRINLENLALQAMCEFYYGPKYADRTENIPGEGRVLSRIMAQYVITMLRCESSGNLKTHPNSVPFIFHSGEDNGGSKVHHWDVDGRNKINFTMSIDRIDWLDDQGYNIRFIDYKTGDDTNLSPTFEQLFTDKKYGAIFQLLLYALAYSDIKHLPNSAIKPLIYRFKDMATKGIPNIKIGGKVVEDHNQTMIIDGSEKRLSDAFRSEISKMLDEIFGTEVPFTQTPDIKHCKYCSFSQICGRVDTSTDR